MSSQSTSCSYHDHAHTLPAASSSSLVLISSSLSTLPVELQIKIAEHVYALPLEREPGFHFSASPWPSAPKREKRSLSRLGRTSRLWHGICAPMLAREYTLTRPFLLDPAFLHKYLLSPYGHLVRQLEVGPEDLRNASLVARVASTITLFPNLVTLSLTCYDASTLMLLQLRIPVYTLELNIQEGYPDPEFFLPLAAHLRTLFFSTNTFPHWTAPRYLLPHVTSLVLASPNHHDLSIFQDLPVERLTFTDGSTAPPTRLARRRTSRTSSDTTSRRSSLSSSRRPKSSSGGRGKRGLPGGPRVVEAIRLLCRECHVEAVLPTIGKDRSDWSAYDTDGLKLHRSDESPNSSECERDVDVDEDESSEVSEVD
ncbi:hypothetical protein JCM8097_008142 [Rhodosporidiobolus ruineniae]